MGTKRKFFAFMYLLIHSFIYLFIFMAIFTNRYLETQNRLYIQNNNIAVSSNRALLDFEYSSGSEGRGAYHLHNPSGWKSCA